MGGRLRCDFAGFFLVYRKATLVARQLALSNYLKHQRKWRKI